MTCSRFGDQRQRREYPSASCVSSHRAIFPSSDRSAEPQESEKIAYSYQLFQLHKDEGRIPHHRDPGKRQQRDSEKDSFHRVTSIMDAPSFSSAETNASEMPGRRGNLRGLSSAQTIR